jgi:uncharacterized protein
MNTIAEKRIAVPWYREPWPWLLMAGPALVIVAGFVTLWLAIRSDDGLVADDYYKRGLAINQTLARAQTARRGNLRAQATFDMTAGRVRVELSGAELPPDALRLRLVHPTRAISDQQVLMREVSRGVYEGNLMQPVAGRRVVMLDDLAGTWRLAGEAVDSAQIVVDLAPR